MTTEMILILSIYAFILLGVFLGDNGPLGTFRNSTPVLAAKVERNISIGQQFQQADEGAAVRWRELTQ